MIKSYQMLPPGAYFWMQPYSEHRHIRVQAVAWGYRAVTGGVQAVPLTADDLSDLAIDPQAPVWIDCLKTQGHRPRLLIGEAGL